MRERFHLARPPKPILERRLAEKEVADQQLREEKERQAHLDREREAQSIRIRLILGTLIVLTGLSLIGASLLITTEENILKGDWEKGNGKVLSSVLTRAAGKQVRYRPRILYTFSFGPRRFLGESHLDTGEGVSRAAADQLLAYYPEGLYVPVYYLRANPEISRLEPPRPFQDAREEWKDWLWRTGWIVACMAFLTIIPWWRAFYSEIEIRPDIVRADSDGK